MPFFTHSTHGATGRTIGTRAPSTGCTCDTRPPAPDRGGDIVNAMRGLVIAAKVDAVLSKTAPLHAQAKGDPLTPRGVLSGKPHSTPERATQGRVAAQGRTPAKTTTKTTGAAPLRPRGILSKGGN
jgi:hypothetical protein